MTIYKVRRTGEEEWVQIEAISIDEAVEKHKVLGAEKEVVEELEHHNRKSLSTISSEIPKKKFEVVE